MDRRVFLLLSGSALTGPAFDWLIAAQSVAGGSGRGRRVEDEHVDAIEQVIDHLRRLDDQFGASTVLDLVRSQLRFVLGLLDQHRYTTQIEMRLYGAAAELLRMAGWQSRDASMHAQAQRYWLAGLRAAHTAGDRGVAANILAFMSEQACVLDMPAEAVKLGEAAGLRAIDNPATATIVSLRAARAYALAGEERRSRETLDRAYETFRDLGPGTPAPSWAYWLNTAQLHEQAGICLNQLDRTGAARSHLRAALADEADPFPRSRALRNVFLAWTYAKDGEPAHACAVLDRAIDILAADHDSPSTLDRIRAVRQALAPYRSTPAVRDLDRRVEALVRPVRTANA